MSDDEDHEWKPIKDGRQNKYFWTWSPKLEAGSQFVYEWVIVWE